MPDSCFVIDRSATHLSRGRISAARQREPRPLRQGVPALTPETANFRWRVRFVRDGFPAAACQGVPPRLGTVREPAAAAAIPALRSCLPNNRFDHDDGPLTGRSNTFCGRVCEVTNGRFVEAKLEKPALGIRQLWRSMTGGYGSIAPLRGFRERSLGLHVLAAPSISPKVGDEWQVYAWSGGPPQRCPNDGFLPLPTFAHEI